MRCRSSLAWTQYVALSSVFVLAACAARPAHTRPAGAEPDRAVVPHAVSRACREAPVLEHRRSMSFTFGPRARLVAVRVRVDQRDLDIPRELTNGDGEVGFGGARHGLDYRVVDEAGHEVLAGTSQACFDHHASLPDEPGVYCVALSPQDEAENPTIEVDYAARQHGSGIVQTARRGVALDIEAVCGDEP